MNYSPIAICDVINGKEVIKGFYRTDFIPNHNIFGVDYAMIIVIAEIAKPCNHSHPTMIQLSKKNIKYIAEWYNKSVKTISKKIQMLINQGVLFREKDDIYVVNHFVLGMGSYKMIEKWKLKFKKKDDVWYYDVMTDNI